MMEAPTVLLMTGLNSLQFVHKVSSALWEEQPGLLIAYVCYSLQITYLP